MGFYIFCVFFRSFSKNSSVICYRVLLWIYSGIFFGEIFRSLLPEVFFGIFLGFSMIFHGTMVPPRICARVFHGVSAKSLDTGFLPKFFPALHSKILAGFLPDILSKYSQFSFRNFSYWVSGIVFQPFLPEFLQDCYSCSRNFFCDLSWSSSQDFFRSFAMIFHRIF